MILGTINCQKLSLNSTDIVADTIDFIEARFVFQSDDWDGLEKWAHFARNGEVYDIRLTDDHIRKEDHLNLSSGKWKVYIHGNEFRGGEVVQRVTTNMVTLYVEPTGTLNGEPFPEMPASVTEQILARLDDVEQNGGGSVGYSPTAKVERVEGGVRVTITDKDGTTSEVVQDGKSGVHVGSDTPPAGTRVWVNPDGKKSKFPQIDETLTKPGYAADAAAVGEKVNQLSGKIAHVQTLVGSQKIEGTSVENTCIKFAKMMYGTDKAESFIFFTDPHVCNPPNADAENKMLTNLGILKTYYDATPTTFVVCGGDWLNDIYQSNTNDDACYKLGRVASHMRANFDRWYTAIGNHEDNYPYGAAYEGAGRNTVEEGLSMETLRNLLLPYEKELYYSFDGAHTKFYVMNSSDVENDQQMTDYRWGQVAWLAERLKEDDSANSALVMHAILLRPIGEGVFAHLAENLLKLCEAYNAGNTITLNGNTYDFSGCTGCVRFVLGGHVHDADCAEIHYGIPVVLTYNMCRSADSGNGYDPVFDLCLADYDKEQISMVRVGDYGTDRNIPLASRRHNYTNLADPTSDDWNSDACIDFDSGIKPAYGQNEGRCTVTNYIPISQGDVLRFKGFDRESLTNGVGPLLVYYDENKEYVTAQRLRSDKAGESSGLPVSVVADENGVIAHTMIIRGDTNEQFIYKDVCTRSKFVRISALRTVPVDEIIVTINEEIV